MKRILIGYDGSPQSEGAMEDLSRSGLPPEIEAAVMTVADVWLPLNSGSVDGTYPETNSAPIRAAREKANQEIQSAQATADRAAERLHALYPKWNVKGVSCGDSPSWGILNKATEWKANLVVMGSHGRSMVERLFLGSVSQKVAAEATCSVRIARPRMNPHHSRLRIVIAVDGSGDSQLAVAEVARRVWPAYCEFHVVAVLDSRMESSLAWPGFYGRDWVRRDNEDAPQAIARIMENDARQLYDAGLIVETHILSGDPKKELLSHAENWEADSIFIGARGIHHGGRLSLGTTASAVTTRAHCSVEIVRPD